jgi:hypothetical protein
VDRHNIASVASGGPYNRADIRTVNIGGFGPAGGGGAATSFNLPLNDLGNGIVNTVPAQSAGSPVATFTRASVAWTKLASGLWGQVATGIARSHYLGRDTGVGAYGGYLAEPTGVQLIPTTAAIRDMRDASWVAVGITPTLTATGIDGVPNACTTLTCTAPNGTILQTLVAAASSRTNSAFVRRRTGGGTILLKQGTATTDITASLSSVIFTRPQLNDNELNVAYGFQMATSGDQIDVDINQFEALPAATFASSPMASTGAARAPDVLSYPTLGNVDLTLGTAYIELSTNWSVANGDTYALSATDNGRFFYVAGSNQSTTMNGFDGTNIVAIGAILTDMNGVVRKRARSWGPSGQKLTGDGLAPASAAFDGVLGAGPNLDILHRTGTSQWNGCAKGIRIFPTQISTAALQAITA